MEPKKHTVLTRFWLGDTVYSVMDGARGLILTVALHSSYEAVRYYVVFDDRKGEWCEDMEVSAEKAFTDTPETGGAKL